MSLVVPRIVTTQFITVDVPEKDFETLQDDMIRFFVLVLDQSPSLSLLLYTKVIRL